MAKIAQKACPGWTAAERNRPTTVLFGWRIWRFRRSKQSPLWIRGWVLLDLLRWVHTRRNEVQAR